MKQELDLQSQLVVAQAEIARLCEENQQMRDRIRTQTETINRAKDINPVARPSFKRVLALARAAGLDLCKCPGGWFLSLGQRVRKFKSLRQIWDILCLDDWFLEDLLGHFLVVKPRKISDVPCDFDGDNSVVAGVLTQAQNSFEVWHTFADAIPFSSE
jgi:hypothetical protein